MATKLRHTLDDSKLILEIARLTPDNIDAESLRRLVSATSDGDALINFRDELVLTSNSPFFTETNKFMRSKTSGSVKTPTFSTTVGRYIANLFLLNFEGVSHLTPYINEPFTKKVIGKVDGIMSELLLEEKITPDMYKDFIDREQWLGYSTAAFTTPSFDYNSIIVSPVVKKRRAELIKANKKSLDRGEIETIIKVEQELLALGVSELERLGSSGMEVFQSGGGGSIGNNFKNSSVARGAIPKSDDMSNFTYSGTTLTEGYNKEEVAAYADMQVLASFSRAVGTQVGGYLVKKMNAAFQHVQIDRDRESDCGTKEFHMVYIDGKSRDFYLRYARELKGTKLILLNSENLSLLDGKVVMMRSPMFCRSDKFCSRCMGDFFHRMQMYSPGLFVSKIGSQVLNKSLKKFHDLSVTMKEIDVIGNITEI
jgi:hypothetical protein